jgi:hypothetical protein
MSTINPRTGRTFDKPPAPTRLRAFFQVRLSVRGFVLSLLFERERERGRE